MIVQKIDSLYAKLHLQQHTRIYRYSATLVMLFTLLMLGTVAPLHAGGWVVITLDELPRKVLANEPLLLGFSVRQHGQTLVNLGPPGPRLVAHHNESGAEVVVTAIQSGPTGHYVAEITFPEAGLWAWEIQPDPFPIAVALPMLWVQTNPAVAPAMAGRADPLWQWWVAVQQWWQALQVQSPLATAAEQEVTAPEQEVIAAAQPLANHGSELFVAKGCASCHVHSAVTVAWNAEVGPELSDYDKSATELRRWLADPAAVKPNTQMPNLQLSAAEIDALAAFLLGDASAEAHAPQ